MIGNFSLRVVIKELGGQWLPGAEPEADVQFGRVSTDTRTLVPGDLFVALKGDQFDGHRFLETAVAAGAVAVVVSEPVASLSVPQWVVSDTTWVLGQLARINRQRYTGKLVALTGSCGKTTVKEMLAAILAGVGVTHATQGNLNNHIGAPHTLLGLTAEHDYAVIEMGASGMGEINYLAELASPDVALVNNVAAAHLQGFGSEAGVAEEKSTIYRHLKPSGVAVVNADNAYAEACVTWITEHRPDIRQWQFSLTQQTATCHARDLRVQADGCYAFQLCLGGESVPVHLPLMGRQNVANSLAAATCAAALGVSLEAIATGLAQVRPVKGRMVPKFVSRDTLVIDDTYNANPASVRAAAATLRDLAEQGRDTVLVLGNLAELGAGRQQALAELGRDLAQAFPGQLLTVGEDLTALAKAFDDGAAAGRSHQLTDKAEAVAFLLKQNRKDTVMLVKGSRSARMEDVVAALTTAKEFN